MAMGISRQEKRRLPKSAARFLAKKRWHSLPPVGLPWDSPPPPAESVGNLSNHDGDAKENVTLKMASKYFKLPGDSFNPFNLSNVAEQSGS